jgi:hypothetical protein
VIPVGIILLLLEVVVELIVEVVERRVFIGRRLPDRQVLLIAGFLFFLSIGITGGGDMGGGWYAYHREDGRLHGRNDSNER